MGGGGGAGDAGNGSDDSIGGDGMSLTATYTISSGTTVTLVLGQGGWNGVDGN